MRTVQSRIPTHPARVARRSVSARMDPDGDARAAHSATSARKAVFVIYSRPASFPLHAKCIHSSRIRPRTRSPVFAPVRFLAPCGCCARQSRSICGHLRRPWPVILTSLWLRPGAVHPCPASPLATCTFGRTSTSNWMPLSSLLKARPCSISNDCFQGPGKHRRRQGTCAS